MGNLLIRWLFNALALMAVAYLYPGVQVDSIVAALVAALFLGFVNTLVRPILVLLTLPVTILTLGLFLFVINAVLFWLVAEFVIGFRVGGFFDSVIGSLLYSLITLAVNSILLPKKQ